MGGLREARTGALETAVGAETRWQCLGAACPASCCNPLAACISISEIIPLSGHFPVFFGMVHPEEGDPYLDICVLMKLGKGNNFCSCLEAGVGCSLGDERPLSCKQYPFSAARDQKGEIKIRVKMSCPGFSVTAGAPVVMPGGGISPQVERECIQHAIIKADMAEETRLFVRTVADLGLIADGCFNYRGESLSFKLVDAKKLYALPAATLQDLRDRGYLELIRAHMDSMFENCKRLIDTYLADAELC